MRKRGIPARIINFPNGKTTGGQAAQGWYEIRLREEFAKMNELTGTLALSSGVQARVSDKSLVESLEDTVTKLNVKKTREEKRKMGSNRVK